MMPRTSGMIRVSVAVLSLTACTTQSGGTAAPSATATVATGASRQAQILRGREVVVASACGDCHGGGGNPAATGWLVGNANLAGEFDIGPMKTRPNNITPDLETGIGRYTDRQIFNALRYGLRPEEAPDAQITSSTPGQGNFPAAPKYLAPTMPWSAWRYLPDQDLWAIAAYLKNGVKPVTNKIAASDRPPDAWASEFTPEKIGPYPAFPHPTSNEVVPAVDLARVLRGRQVVIQKDCGGCHGGGSNPAEKGFLAGITSPAGEFPIGPFKTRPRNLTPDNATGMGRFTERQIFNALRYGLRPGETPDVEITSTTPGQGNFPANPRYLAPPMPWPAWRHMPDADLWAIAAYLKNGMKPVVNKVADSDGPPDFWASEYTVAKIGTHPPPAFPTENEKH